MYFRTRFCYKCKRCCFIYFILFCSLHYLNGLSAYKLYLLNSFKSKFKKPKIHDTQFKQWKSQIMISLKKYNTCLAMDMWHVQRHYLLFQSLTLLSVHMSISNLNGLMLTWCWVCICPWTMKLAILSAFSKRRV